MDLFEYQARDMFEKHGVPVLAGAIATTPEEARAAAERIGPKSGGVTVVKAQVKTGGRGKAGGVKVDEEPRRGAGRGRGDPRHGHQGPHRRHRDDRPGRPHRRGVLLLGAARPRQPHLPRHVLQGGRHGDRAARRRAPRGARPHRRRPQHGHRRRQGRRRSSTPPASTTPTRPPDRRRPRRSCGPSTATRTRRSSRSTRSSRPRTATIIALDGKVTLDENADFRHADHEALEDTAARRPARGRRQGEGPQLRQARRLRRHHRQRRGARHEHPRRRRVRR